MTAPEIPHADLIARAEAAWAKADIYSLDGAQTRAYKKVYLRAFEDAADALAALGDTVPVAEHERLVDDAEAVLLKDLTEANNDRLRFEDGYNRVRAERDALAHVIEQTLETLRAGSIPLGMTEAAFLNHLVTTTRQTLNAASPVSLARRDAEVKAQTHEESAEHWSNGHGPERIYDWHRARAAAIRKVAK